VAAQSTHTTTKCGISRLRSLAEEAHINPAKEQFGQAIIILIRAVRFKRCKIYLINYMPELISLSSASLVMVDGGIKAILYQAAPSAKYIKLLWDCAHMSLSLIPGFIYN
jgi:hypothetical protein